MTAQIILASASPRRMKLLAQFGIEALVSPVKISETPKVNEAPDVYVQRLAAEKSRMCNISVNPVLPVLAADTAVVVNGQILGKPKNKADGLFMLTLLSGRTHEVYSAISLRGKQHWQALNRTEVTFKAITEEEMLWYWNTGEPVDKAGGYAIQGFAASFIETITGSYSGVMGLPLYETSQLLAKEGINILL